MEESFIARFWNGILNVPSADPDDARRRKMLNILLLWTIAATIAFILYIFSYITLNFNSLTSHQQSDIVTLTYANIGLLVGAALFYIINRFVSGWLASVLFLVFLVVTLSFSDVPSELVNGRALFAYIIPIVMASMLLKPGASFIFAGLGALAVQIVAYYGNCEPNLPAIIGFFFIAFLTWLSSRTLEKALEELRRINADLDKEVTKRTSDLAEALTRERIEARRNQAILNSIADGVAVFNDKSAAILINPTLRDFMGSPQPGITLNEFIENDGLSPLSRNMLLDLIKHPENTQSDIRIEWGKKTLSVSAAHVQDEEAGKSIGAVAVFRDVTREAELEKMKETFVAIVSHELRTPLNAVMGYVEMLSEKILGPINEKQTEALGRIMVNLQRLLTMVGELLDEAQIKAGKLSIKKEPFPTASLLENMHTSLYKIAVDHDLYLTGEMGPGMPEILIGDQKRLQQIIINLANNAIKFTQSGGVQVRLTRADHELWKIEVSDTGDGIPAADIPNIFDSFRQLEYLNTRKHGGFGLGLSIVKQIVALMNGEILVQSELGKGSTFTVTLPLQKDL
jgi:signal transduction histidine kinase